MTEEIYVAKFLICLAIFLKASQLDLKERIVPNRYWKLMLLAVTPFNVVEFLSYSTFDFVFAIIQIAFVSSLAYLLYKIGAYGGADAKALMALSYAFPHYPEVGSFPLLIKGFSFAFSTLANAVIAAPLLAIYMFLSNLIKGNVSKGEVFYSFIGTKVRVENFPEFYNLLEIARDGKVEKVRRGVEPDEKILRELGKLKKEVWATPALPFLVFLTAGLIVAFFVGDVLIYVLSFIL